MYDQTDDPFLSPCVSTSIFTPAEQDLQQLPATPQSKFDHYIFGVGSRLCGDHRFWKTQRVFLCSTSILGTLAAQGNKGPLSHNSCGGTRESKRRRSVGRQRRPPTVTKLTCLRRGTEPASVSFTSTTRTSHEITVSNLQHEILFLRIQNWILEEWVKGNGTGI